MTAYLGERAADGRSTTWASDSAASQRDLPGGAPSGPPADQDFWTAQAAGAGTQQLSWVPAEGDWMLVVMNADGSAGISVDARIGATVPALDGLGWGLLVAGWSAWRSRVAPAGAGDPASGRPPGARTSRSPWPVPAGTRSRRVRTAAAAGPLPPWVPPAQADRTTAPDAQPSPERTPNQP